MDLFMFSHVLDKIPTNVTLALGRFSMSRFDMRT